MDAWPEPRLDPVGQRVEGVPVLVDDLTPGWMMSAAGCSAASGADPGHEVGLR